MRDGTNAVSVVVVKGQPVMGQHARLFHAANESGQYARDLMRRATVIKRGVAKVNFQTELH